MAKYKGLTNSGMFVKDKKFNIESAFEYYSTSILNAKKDLRFVLNNKDLHTEEKLQSLAERLADEFYTLAKVAIQWETDK